MFVVSVELYLFLIRREGLGIAFVGLLVFSIPAQLMACGYHGWCVGAGVFCGVLWVCFRELSIQEYEGIKNIVRNGA